MHMHFLLAFRFFAMNGLGGRGRLVGAMLYSRENRQKIVFFGNICAAVSSIIVYEKIIVTFSGSPRSYPSLPSRRQCEHRHRLAGSAAAAGQNPPPAPPSVGARLSPRRGCAPPAGFGP